MVKQQVIKSARHKCHSNRTCVAKYRDYLIATHQQQQQQHQQQQQQQKRMIERAPVLAFLFIRRHSFMLITGCHRVEIFCISSMNHSPKIEQKYAVNDFFIFS